MKRFKKILAIYDFGVGAEETLDKAIVLALQNDAHLSVLHMVESNVDFKEMVHERKKLMNRLFDGIDLHQDQFDVIVKTGDQLEAIMACLEEEKIDLIVTPTQSGNGWAQLLGTDLTAELMRRTHCPIWVVRPGESKHYRKIIAAVNAGKSNALTCPINQRILQMAASLAAREDARLDVIFAWEYDKDEKEKLLSELPDHVRHDMSRKAHDNAEKTLNKLLSQVLGPDHNAHPVVRYGDMEEAILDYVKEIDGDLLVTEGSAGNPLVNALLGNKTLRILNQAHCSVLISRPEPQHNLIKTLSGHPHRGVEIKEKPPTFDA